MDSRPLAQRREAVAAVDPTRAGRRMTATGRVARFDPSPRLLSLQMSQPRLSGRPAFVVGGRATGGGGGGGGAPIKPINPGGGSGQTYYDEKKPTRQAHCEHPQTCNYPDCSCTYKPSIHPQFYSTINTIFRRAGGPLGPDSKKPHTASGGPAGGRPDAKRWLSWLAAWLRHMWQGLIGK